MEKACVCVISICFRNQLLEWSVPCHSDESSTHKPESERERGRESESGLLEALTALTTSTNGLGLASGTFEELLDVAPFES